MMMILQKMTALHSLHLQGHTMGTTYNVKVVTADKVDGSALQADIDALLVNVNQLMSTYIADSELSRFNQWNSVEPFPLSAQTLQVMREAKRLGELSGGVLDVTVGPLVNLWGFGPKARPVTVPDAALIAQVKGQTGLDKLLLGDTTAQKTHTDLYVDLSTIAKGYGVDVVADLIEQRGITNYLVEIGGEMRVAGHKANDEPWRIAVEKPVSEQRLVQRLISIGNNAIATSGDYRNYYEEDGKRYSHLIDPRTGYPIEHNLVAVTVVHPSSMTADGLATALNVMGKEAAIALAEKEHLAVLLISRESDGFFEYTSPAFEQNVKTYQL
ncbi:FAD:protein FMN transferase [Aestuariibacter halophilus]|uniref:FAD:protein FMN transferase n=1 Tax=Fluctibacter halophilus TaxID=226011 RepID=A0ABS8GDD6_9ALTE|nr:FAD:protein FMN transferase [Aestuariibacter halophilus]MCC2617895.1 FAD:protein FMN transferase [Aestuariibacter halophilus]